MFSLYRKEIATFFCSATGYLVVSVFLTATGLFLWIVPGQSNIIYGGYATLEPLFAIAPWIFLLLVPAVAMRLIADERRTGTMELLLIRPLSALQIVTAKYLAGLTVVLISIVPTLAYVAVVWQLGSTPGNLDVGATTGSYIGLMLLGAVYMALSLFASSTTDNQITAFVVGAVLCFAFYAGFDSLATIPALSGVATVIESCGIASHYNGISRGVIDSRDLIYFASTAAAAVYLTSLRLRRR